MNALIGKKIENYKILSVLGKGGMGVVYGAIDEKLNRKVAIKVLNSSHISNKSHVIERFKSEAQNHAQLLHQNIVTVYGFIEFDNQFAIVMEYVEGESLEKVILNNKRLHISDVVYIALQLLEGIGYAHSKGYIHRDIKPSNIIINSDGIVKIMDFGISKSLLEETGNTKTGMRVGTIYYMSPEQIQGHEVTTISDIYSIGCTLFEMITGFPPFYGQNEFDIMAGHMQKQLPPIDQFGPNLSTEINHILHRMLSKDPAKRYQSCNEGIIAFHFLDQNIKNSQNDYFENKKRRKILSRKKSIFGFSSLVIIFVILVIFVFFQVKDFMQAKGYSIFEDGEISTEYFPNIDSSFSITATTDLGTKLSLNSASFDKNLSGLIVGDSCLVLSYNVDKKYWNRVKSITSSNLKDIFISPNGSAIIVGENSSIIKYDPQSDLLESQSIVEGDYSLFGIDFIDHSTGIIVGSQGIILQSHDGGKVWRKIRTKNSSTLFDCKFVSKKKGFIVGMNGTILKTEDLGATWKGVEIDTDKYLKSLSFLDKKIGLIVGGAGIILRTSNGGDNWKVLEHVSDNALNKVKFINDDLALIVGANGTVLTSKNLGETWEIVEPKLYNNWHDIIVKSNDRISLIGNMGQIAELKRGEP